MTRLVPTVLLLLACAPSLSAGPYDDLLKSVPPHTNTLVLVNVKAAFASPLGRAEKWANDYFHRYRAGIGFVPPDAEAVVIASEVNLSALTRDYQIGLMKVRNLPNMNDLAARLGGTTDRLGDQVSTLAPEDVYFIGLPGSVLAGVYPANRQAATRWVKYVLSGKPAELSPYLKRAAESTGSDVLTVAVDLSDAADPTLLRYGLSASPAVVRQTGLDVGPVAKFVASAQGMRVSVQVADGIRASVRLDFGFEIAPYRRIARELFLELLDQQGAAIPGMSAWETSYEERSMTLTGALQTADLRRILSLFAFPGHVDEEEPKVTPGEVSVAATRRFLAAVEVVLADLRKVRETPDYRKTATWNEKAAAQLDQLNRRAVDPIAVTAAYDASRRLRALAGSLRGVPINLEAIGSQAGFTLGPNIGVGASSGWWGGRSSVMLQVQTNFPEVWKAQQKIIDDDKKRRTDVWIQIDELLVEAKMKLSDKHRTRF